MFIAFLSLRTTVPARTKRDIRIVGGVAVQLVLKLDDNGRRVVGLSLRTSYQIVTKQQDQLCITLEHRQYPVLRCQASTDHSRVTILRQNRARRQPRVR